LPLTFASGGPGGNVTSTVECIVCCPPPSDTQHLAPDISPYCAISPSHNSPLPIPARWRPEASVIFTLFPAGRKVPWDFHGNFARRRLDRGIPAFANSLPDSGGPICGLRESPSDSGNRWARERSSNPGTGSRFGGGQSGNCPRENAHRHDPVQARRSRHYVAQGATCGRILA